MQVNTFFRRQNTFLKFFIVLCGITCSAVLDLTHFIIIFFATVLYMVVCPGIYIVFLKTLLKLLPFFISFFIFGIIFKIAFDEHCIVAARIIYILLLSVYIVNTSSTEDFLADSSWLPKNTFIENIKFFIVATIHFIPVFVKQYKTASKRSGKIFNIINESFNLSIDEIKSVEIETMKKISMVKERKDSLFANLYLVILLLIYLFAFAF